MRDLSSPIQLVGFDADDTLWRSQDYFDEAQLEFERLVGHYVDLHARGARDRLYEIEKHNIAVFGYGVKGMVLSMIEAAVEITDQRVSAADLQRIVAIGKDLLRHPVELLPGITDAVSAIADEYDVVLITKGDLFHQERKAPPSRRRAKNCKRLNCMSFALLIRRRKGRSCSPMEPDVRQNCLGFATISGAA